MVVTVKAEGATPTAASYVNFFETSLDLSGLCDFQPSLHLVWCSGICALCVLFIEIIMLRSTSRAVSKVSRRSIPITIGFTSTMSICCCFKRKLTFTTTYRLPEHQPLLKHAPSPPSSPPSPQHPLDHPPTKRSSATSHSSADSWVTPESSLSPKRSSTPTSNPPKTLHSPKNSSQIRCFRTQTMDATSVAAPTSNSSPIE